MSQVLCNDMFNFVSKNSAPWLESVRSDSDSPRRAHPAMTLNLSLLMESVVTHDTRDCLALFLLLPTMFQFTAHIPHHQNSSELFCAHCACLLRLCQDIELTELNAYHKHA